MQLIIDLWTDLLQESRPFSKGYLGLVPTLGVEPQAAVVSAPNPNCYATGEQAFSGSESRFLASQAKN